MKKFFFTFNSICKFFFSNSQEQMLLEEVSLSVDSGKCFIWYIMDDDFYSSIDMPEGSCINIDAIQNKS